MSKEKYLARHYSPKLLFANPHPRYVQFLIVKHIPSVCNINFECISRFLDHRFPTPSLPLSIAILPDIFPFRSQTAIQQPFENTVDVFSESVVSQEASDMGL